MNQRLISIEETQLEMYQDIKDIKNILHSIVKEFIPKKQLMAKRILNVQHNSTNINEVELELLHTRVDDKLLTVQNEILEKSDPEPFIFEKEYIFIEVFETTSIDMLRSALTTENLVKKEKLLNFDYSLCAVGYWKVLEIELNIVVADAIRYIKSLIKYIPSFGETVNSRPLNVYSV